MIETSLSQQEPMTLPERPRGGLLHSVFVHSLLTALMIVTLMQVFVPAVLLHCGIRNGRRAAWAALGVALAIASLYAAAVPAVGAMDVILTFIAIALPAMVVLPLVERGENLGRVMVFMLLASAAGLLLAEVASRELLSVSPFAREVEQMRAKYGRDLEVYRTSGMPSSQIATIRKAQNFSLSYVPAGMLMSMSLFFLVSLLMLGRLKAWRDLVAQRGDATRSGAYLFRNLAMPDWVLFAFVAGGLAPLLSGFLQKAAGNVLALVVFLYVIQGFAILRFILAAVGVGLLGTLLGLVFIGVPTSPLLGLAGLFDPFFDFRHFKKRKDDSNESHSD